MVDMGSPRRGWSDKRAAPGSAGPTGRGKTIARLRSIAVRGSQRHARAPALALTTPDPRPYGCVEVWRGPLRPPQRAGPERPMSYRPDFDCDDHDPLQSELNALY